METTFYKHTILIFLLSSWLLSCESSVDVGPPNSEVVSAVVFSSDELAISAMKGTYHRLFRITGFASGSLYSVTSLGGLSADEFILHNTLIYPALPEFYENQIDITNSGNSNVWSSAYNSIYNVNALLEGLENSEALSSAVKSQLEGEAKFLRAFAYFYLVHMYGDVPLLTTTSYSTNALAPRSSVDEVYRFIRQDLEDAAGLMTDEYPGQDRTRPNSFAAVALLARLHLYSEHWAEAEREATRILEATDRYGLQDNPDDVFLANSKEAIWQIAPVGSTGHTFEGNSFILNSANSILTPVSLRESFVETFESDDKRLKQWIGTFDDGTAKLYYPHKYKISFTTEIPTEHSTALRVAEQLLIRAEARARQGKLPEAIDDLDQVRRRAGVPLMADTNPGISQSDLLDAVFKERRSEFFAEWGHRWFDLKRTGKAITALQALKPGIQPTALLYPIPEQELMRNPNLVPNEGY